MSRRGCLKRAQIQTCVSRYRRFHQYLVQPATGEKVWNRLLSGVVFDALEAGESYRPPLAEDIEQLLAQLGDLPWGQTPAVGEGEEYRTESERGDHASALAFQETVIHGSVVTAVTEQERNQVPESTARSISIGKQRFRAKDHPRAFANGWRVWRNWPRGLGERC